MRESKFAWGWKLFWLVSPIRSKDVLESVSMMIDRYPRSHAIWSPLYIAESSASKLEALPQELENPWI